MKIPTPRKRGETYTITVTYQNKRYYCTRDTAKECEQWAAIKLLELKTGKAQEEKGVKPHYSFALLFEQYYEDVGKKKPSKDWILSQKKSFHKKLGNLAEMSVHDITPEHLTAWRKKRQKQVKDSTVSKEISLYSAIFTYAVQELFLLSRNPWFDVAKPEMPEDRHRRISDDEIDTMLDALNYKIGQVPTRAEHYVAWAFLFAIETAMRRGEILMMRKQHIYDGYVHLPKTKNGTKRDVPLSKFAKELISLIPDENDKIIPQNQNAFRLMWERRRNKTDIVDLHFHDTRHEAISRMVKVRKLPVEVLAKVTGHKNIKTLVNTYYNPNADELVEMFNENE